MPSPFAPVKTGPRIALKVAPVSESPASLLPKSAPSANQPFAPTAELRRIALPLRPILRELPPVQLTGPVETVEETATLEVPFSIVEPQLSLGRVAIAPTDFQAAMPAEYRHLFNVGGSDVPVPLPLQQVLANLPNDSLQLRVDQVETEIAETFETPFSQKAAEDAVRLKTPAGPIAKPALAAIAIADEDAGVPSPEAGDQPQAIAFAEHTPDSPLPTRNSLQVVLDTDEVLDAKSIVNHTSKLPGVRACAIVFSDGLSLAGNIPADYEADALCAMAPAIVKRIGDQMNATKLGSLDGVTVFCSKAPVSFFAHGNICLAALHSAGEIAVEIRSRLGRIAAELAQIYSDPASCLTPTS